MKNAVAFQPSIPADRLPSLPERCGKVVAVVIHKAAEGLPGNLLDVLSGNAKPEISGVCAVITADGNWFSQGFGWKQLTPMEILAIGRDFPSAEVFKVI
jgi:hypothetical protein